MCSTAKTHYEEPLKGGWGGWVGVRSTCGEKRKGYRILLRKPVEQLEDLSIDVVKLYFK
jgi:hypothetical protein